jgi:hypothetical protein
MESQIVQERADRELFASRFAVTGLSREQTPISSVQIGNDDTNTWRRDTEDADT